MSTTFSLSTSGLHGLLGPVLPHVGTDRDLPELTTIRIEVRDNTVYAVATDRFTFAATRHQLDEGEDVANTAVTIAGGDAHTLLRVFKHTRLTGDVERLQDSVWCKELPEVELGGAA